jgi:hypothetical protein
LVVADMGDKFGADGFRERSSGTPEVVRPLREHVNVTPEGWVVDGRPMPAGIAAIVQCLISTLPQFLGQKSGTTSVNTRTNRSGRGRWEPSR